MLSVKEGLYQAKHRAAHHHDPDGRERFPQRGRPDRDGREDPADDGLGEQVVGPEKQGHVQLIAIRVGLGVHLPGGRPIMGRGPPVRRQRPNLRHWPVSQHFVYPSGAVFLEAVHCNCSSFPHHCCAVLPRNHKPLADGVSAAEAFRQKARAQCSPCLG